MLGEQLISLRKLNKFSQKALAKNLGVTRQTIAKWESNESIPDLLTADKLAKLYKIPINALIDFNQECKQPKSCTNDRYVFGTVEVNLNGEIKFPKEALETFQIKPRDEFLLLGDLERGFELLYTEYFWKSIQKNVEDLL